MERVAHISLHGDPLEPLGSIEAGGQNVYVRNVAAEMARRGIKADVYTRWNSPSKTRIEEIAPGARSIRLQGGPRSFVKKEKLEALLPQMLDDFYDFTRRNGLRYDVIHTHYYVEGAFGLEACRTLRLPQVHTFHSLGRVKYHHESLQGNPDRAAYEKRFEVERRLMASCDRLVATSPHEARDFRDWYGHDNHNTVVVPCGLDPALFRAEERSRARARLGLPEGRTLILYVGRFDPRKGLETLLFAYRKLLFDLGPEAERVLLVIVGGSSDPEAEDPETRHFRRLAASLQLEEADPRLPRAGQVCFAGAQPQDRVALYYAAADFTVVPSCYEPFGMVAIEAQACGTPVIASAVGGLRHAVEEGAGGLLVKPYLASDLCDKMHRLVADPDLRAELGRRGRARVLKHFTWSAVGEALLARYEEMLREKSRLRPLSPSVRLPLRKTPALNPALTSARGLPFVSASQLMGGVPAATPAPGR